MRFFSAKKETYAVSQASWAFALPEALFGMVIVGVVFTALYSGMTYGFQMVKLSRENLRAAQILQEKFETIRLCNWDQINSNGFVSTNFSVPLYKGLSNEWYTGTVTIAPPPFTQPYTNELRLITVQITWTNGVRRCSRNMASMIARYGLQDYVY
jgi:type II secretory pathway pseudopilin PulG